MTILKAPTEWKAKRGKCLSKGELLKFIRNLPDNSPLFNSQLNPITGIELGTTVDDRGLVFEVVILKTTTPE